MLLEGQQADDHVLSVALTDPYSYHTDLNMDTLVSAVRDLFFMVTNKRPNFKVHGGSSAENLALQNIQVKQLCARFNVSLISHI